jgi:glyoxylase-like metal-dependent hydrolase (beta-lactamase superfamily II)
MLIETFVDRGLSNFSYVVADEHSRRGVVIDPTGDTDRIIAFVRAERLAIVLVLNTHSHADHTSGNGALVAATGAKVAAHRSATVRKDLGLDDGAVLVVGSLRIRVIHTPGHTPDGVCFLVGGRLFSGDTLFVGECGRADLPGGDASALHDSLFVKLATLPDETELRPGHDYGPRPVSTLGEERRSNYTLAPRSRAEFMAFMAEP